MAKTNSGSSESELAEVAESYNQWLREKIERVCRRESMRPGYVGKLQKIDASLREPLGGYAHLDFGLCRRARDVGASFGAFRLKAASSCAGSSRRLLSSGRDGCRLGCMQLLA